MQRPPLTYADRAVLRHALAERRPHSPQEPRSGVTSVWAPLAQKLSALLLRRGAGLATRKSPARG